jgi:ATP-dependent DNA helicase RecG
MSGKGQNTDLKSLRLFTRKNPAWDELAKDCVCFANAHGGRLLIGIDDGEREPPGGQRIAADLIEKVRRRIGDVCKPLVGEEVQRLLNERTAQPCETLTTLSVSEQNCD